MYYQYRTISCATTASNYQHHLRCLERLILQQSPRTISLAAVTLNYQSHRRCLTLSFSPMSLAAVTSHYKPHYHCRALSASSLSYFTICLAAVVSHYHPRRRRLTLSASLLSHQRRLELSVPPLPHIITPATASLRHTCPFHCPPPTSTPTSFASPVA